MWGIAIVWGWDMILSAIGLPMPGQSIVNLPPPPSDRTEGTQAVGAAVAPGGASRPRDADTNAGSGAGRQSARDEARVIRLSTAASAPSAEAIAGPQPAFEIAVLEKLREDAMRAPPEASEAPPPPPEEQPDAPAPRQVAQAEPEVRADRADAARASDAAAATRDPANEPPRDAAPRTVERSETRDRAPATRADAARERVREPADEGFDDARRMSEERSPPRVDVMR